MLLWFCLKVWINQCVVISYWNSKNSNRCVITSLTNRFWDTGCFKSKIIWNFVANFFFSDRKKNQWHFIVDLLLVTVGSASFKDQDCLGSCNLAIGFGGHLQIIEWIRKVQIHNSSTLLSCVWYFLFLRFPWYLTHSLLNISCSQWLRSEDLWSIYLVMINQFLYWKKDVIAFWSKNITQTSSLILCRPQFLMCPVF